MSDELQFVVLGSLVLLFAQGLWSREHDKLKFVGHLRERGKAATGRRTPKSVSK